jgi:repressor LexA
MTTLTKRQKELLDFIEYYSDENGYAPTLREICDRFGLSSVATAHKHLSRLIEKGYISRTPNVSRALETTPLDAGTISSEEIPMMGYIAAGKPIEAVQGSDTISIPASMLGKNETYVLQVKGNSMIDEQIRDGDFVVIEQRSHAENGETVVALINGEETTLKKYYREGEKIRLQPANPEMEPIFVDEDNLSIQGVVIAILRKYR